MQYQIPQFIETEDKIIGPLSLKQFAYVAIGGFFCFLLFFILKTFVWIFISIIVMVSCASLAFLKFNGQRLPTILVYIVKYIWRPKFYLWMTPREKPAPKFRLGAADEESSYVAESVPTPESGAKADGTYANEARALRAKESFIAKEGYGDLPAEVAQHKEEKEVEEAEPEEKISGLKGLWLRLTTSRRAVPKREGRPPVARQTKSDEIFSLFRKITGDREMARRVDYR